jgi:hypothetical protein
LELGCNRPCADVGMFGGWRGVHAWNEGRRVGCLRITVKCSFAGFRRSRTVVASGHSSSASSSHAAVLGLRHITMSTLSPSLKCCRLKRIAVIALRNSSTETDSMILLQPCCRQKNSVDAYSELV